MKDLGEIAAVGHEDLEYYNSHPFGVAHVARAMPAHLTMPIVRVALPVAALTEFDYWVPEGLAVARGALVRVKLGARRLVGVVTAIAGDSDIAREKLQPIADIVAGPSLSDDVVDLAAFVAAYYQEPTGRALALAVPPLADDHTARRAAPSALRLTDAGMTKLPERLARAPAARALFDQFRAGEGVLAAATIAVLPAHVKRTLRAWRDAGFVDAAEIAAMRSGEPAFELNAAQTAAAAEIVAAAGSFAAFLLFGVTGSGKTDVYFAAIDAMLANGRQVLMLVPEINLTPQLVNRVRAARPGIRIATLHSGLAAGERRAEWLAAASGTAQLVLGTRLAVFTPLPALSLIVVDEEHDTSYKQQDNVRYHARDAAIWRAHRLSIPVVLGSATPSLESWLHAREGRYRRLDLPQRADPRAAMPRVSFAGNRAARAFDGIGEALRFAIAARLERGEQSLVFVNRRGYAPSLVCAACKWEAQCPRCSARLTTHREPPSLRCHHCGHGERVPAACPSCGNVDLLPLGYGTQRLERCLADAFPHARIARVDRDSTRAKHAFAAVRDRVTANELDILVGTQMLAKGHDFPRLTLVGVLGADNALYSADFRATERLAALLMQVAGRAGRAGLPGDVIVQTDFPDHPVFAALAAHDYPRFADVLLDERRDAQLPPFAHVALLAVEAHHRADVDWCLAAAHAAATALVADAHGDVTVFSPVPALLSRRAGFERGQIVVQCDRRAPLQRFLPAWRATLAALPGRRARWALDVDPAGFG
jgi:primosomal protein N' (replication factor Y)